MKWFKDLSTVEAVKSKYRELVKKYHPDVSGKDTNSQMAEINKEYKEALKKAGKKENWSSQDIEDEILEQEDYKNVLNKLFKISDIVVELAGTWIWVTGNTYPHRNKIKEAGCKFAPKKKVWYWRPESQKRKSRGKSIPMEEIRAKYESKVLNSNKKYYLNDRIIIKTKKRKRK